jgi:hypothetical protein
VHRGIVGVGGGGGRVFQEGQRLQNGNQHFGKPKTGIAG